MNTFATMYVSQAPLLAEMDWSIIINAISLAIIAILTTYMKLKTEKAAVERAEMKKTLRQVKAQGDGQRTELKKTVAISAENLANSTNKPAHRKIAIEAWQAYEASVHAQNTAESHESHDAIEESLGTILGVAKESATAVEESSKAAEVAKVAANVAVAKVVDAVTDLAPAVLVPLVADKPVVVEKTNKPAGKPGKKT